MFSFLFDEAATHWVKNEVVDVVVVGQAQCGCFLRRSFAFREEVALSHPRRTCKPTPLGEALTRIAERATAAGDLDAARAATLGLATVAQMSGDQDQAEQILFRWIDTNPGDREVLLVMRIRFEAEERWDYSASVWSCLV